MWCTEGVASPRLPAPKADCWGVTFQPGMPACGRALQPESLPPQLLLPRACPPSLCRATPSSWTRLPRGRSGWERSTWCSTCGAMCSASGRRWSPSLWAPPTSACSFPRTPSASMPSTQTLWCGRSGQGRPSLQQPGCSVLQRRRPGRRRRPLFFPFLNFGAIQPCLQDLMKGASDVTNVVAACTVEGRQERLEAMLQQLELCEKALQVKAAAGYGCWQGDAAATGSTPSASLLAPTGQHTIGIPACTNRAAHHRHPCLHQHACRTTWRQSALPSRASTLWRLPTCWTSWPAAATRRQ